MATGISHGWTGFKVLLVAILDPAGTRLEMSLI